MQQTQMTKY